MFCAKRYSTLAQTLRHRGSIWTQRRLVLGLSCTLELTLRMSDGHPSLAGQRSFGPVSGPSGLHGGQQIGRRHERHHERRHQRHHEHHQPTTRRDSTMPTHHRDRPPDRSKTPYLDKRMVTFKPMAPPSPESRCGSNGHSPVASC